MSAPIHVTLGRYELLARLASGGMGEIFLARLRGQAGFAKLVVVKRLLPALVPAQEFVAMFLDEARLAARLSHPNVCEVHDLGSEDGQYYIVMQYLEGAPFAKVMVREPGGDPAAHLRLVGSLLAQACEGLHHAHELTDDEGHALGVVHRDVSPSNLFVTADGVLKVLDFGIAKARSAESVTEKGMLKGKFAYMSPEQIGEGSVDRRSDVFCLGILLHEAITGQRLFRRDSPGLAAKAILEEPIADVREACPAAPPALAAVVARALARDPAARFASAQECGVALGAALAPLGGPLATTEIAAIMRRRFADELARQRAQYRSSATTAEVDALEEETTYVRLDPLTGEMASAMTGAMAGGTTHGKQANAQAPTVAASGRARRAESGRPFLYGAALVAVAGIGVLVVMGRDCADRAGAPASPAPLAAATREDAAPAASVVPIVVPGADAGVAAIVRVAGPAEPRPPARATRSRPPRAPAGSTGRLSIDSTPYATIFLDGKRLGDTPLIRVTVPAGRHTLRAVLADGRERASTVDVPDGGDAPPIQLSW